jgi:hypothetical protein
LLQELVLSIRNNIFNKVDDGNYISEVILQANLGKEVTVKNIKTYNQSNHDILMDNYIED